MTDPILPSGNRLMVIGCSRSGTKRLAAALRACGLAVSHDAVSADHLGTDGAVGWLYAAWPSRCGDAPLIDPADFQIVFHQVRCPLDVSRSTPTHSATLWRNVDALVGPLPSDPLARGLTYWLRWTSRCAQLSTRWYRVEDLPRAFPLPLVGFARAWRRARTNSRADRATYLPRPTWEEAEAACPGITAAAATYGYGPDTQPGPRPSRQATAPAAPQPLPTPTGAVMRGELALDRLLTHPAYTFHSVLDIGSGAGAQAARFAAAGKEVTAVDFGSSVYYERGAAQDNPIRPLIGDFNTMRFDRTFDCIWCSHVLEHQLAPHAFLRRLHALLPEGGILAITVPPLKHTIVGGHLSLWNAGLLLVHLVLAGFDCRQAAVRSHGYDISVILHKATIDVHADLVFDAGDIRAISRYLPPAIDYVRTAWDLNFNGQLANLNWD